jgi:ketosteroid isomerase-like protein
VTACPDILGGVSEANVERIKEVEAAFNRGDLDAMVGYLAPDAEWELSENNPAARTLHGREEILAYLEDWRDTVRGLFYRGTRYIDAGNAVVQVGTMTGRAGEDGPELTVSIAFVTHFSDDGVPVRTEEYLDVEQAFEAAGVAAA